MENVLHSYHKTHEEVRVINEGKYGQRKCRDMNELT